MSRRKPTVCVAGGVAFNSATHGGISLNTPFREVYIQAAAGDSGTALFGACFYIHNVLLEHPRSFVMEHAYTGPEFANGQIDESKERVARNLRNSTIAN